MGKRRSYSSSNTEKPNPWMPAHAGLNTLEQRVGASLCSRFEVTMMETCHWVWPENLMRIFVAARDHVEHYSTIYRDSHATYNGHRVTLEFHLDGIMALPTVGQTRFSPHPVFDQLMPDLIKLGAAFDGLHAIFRWFHRHNATPATVRRYFPAALSVLPAEHPIHQASGERARDIPGLADLLPQLRDGATIIAEALLCPERTLIKSPAKIGVMNPFDPGQVFHNLPVVTPQV